jgi:type IX secretion system substrate protein/Reeler domain-containing protein
MNKKIHIQPILIIIPVLALLFSSYYDGAPAAVTGSPGDVASAPSGSNGSCIDCHSSADTYNAYNTSIEITSNIPTGGYALNHKYTITVTQTSTGATENGFQITAENSVASKVGQFSALETVNTKIQNLGGNIASHVTNTALGGDVNSWSFYWTSPSIDVGAITFYVSGIAGNKINGGHTTRDTEFASATLTIDNVLGVNDAQYLNFSLYPNPSDSKVNLQLPSGINNAKAQVFDYLGKTLIQKNLTNTNNFLNVSNLSTGVYFVKIQSDTKVGTKKLIVR